MRYFAAKLYARDAGPLADWLKQLTTVRLPALASWPKPSEKVSAAVVQGITTPLTPASTKAAWPT